jgi:hypothetical protein
MCPEHRSCDHCRCDGSKPVPAHARTSLPRCCRCPTRRTEAAARRATVDRSCGICNH